MQQGLTAQEFQQRGCTTSECAVKIGKVLNMQYMYYGIVMKTGSIMYVSAELINVETSRIESSARVEVKSIEALEGGIRGLVEELLQQRMAKQSGAVEEFLLSHEGLYLGGTVGQFFDTVFTKYYGVFYGFDLCEKVRLFGHQSDVMKWIGIAGVTGVISFGNSPALTQPAYLFMIEPYVSPFLGIDLRFGAVSIGIAADTSMPVLITGAGVGNVPYTIYMLMWGVSASSCIKLQLTDGVGLFAKIRATYIILSGTEHTLNMMSAGGPMQGRSSMYGTWQASAGFVF